MLSCEFLRSSMASADSLRERCSRFGGFPPPLPSSSLKDLSLRGGLACPWPSSTAKASALSTTDAARRHSAATRSAPRAIAESACLRTRKRTGQRSCGRCLSHSPHLVPRPLAAGLGSAVVCAVFCLVCPSSPVHAPSEHTAPLRIAHLAGAAGQQRGECRRNPATRLRRRDGKPLATRLRR